MTLLFSSRLPHAEAQKRVQAWALKRGAAEAAPRERGGTGEGCKARSEGGREEGIVDKKRERRAGGGSYVGVLEIVFAHHSCQMQPCIPLLEHR